VVTTTKKLLVFDTETWTLHNAIRVFPKAATKVMFDSEDKFIFISQRSGDVHRFSMNENGKAYRVNKKLPFEHFL
jgi:hypothetical protein